MRLSCAKIGSLLFIMCLSFSVSGAENSGVGATYSQMQFDEGAILYREHCESCHGGTLDGGSASSLRDQAFREAWDKPGVSVDDLFYIIKSNMPPEQTATIDEQGYLAILAYILGNNSIPVSDSPLRVDSATLAAIEMPVYDASSFTPRFIRGENGISPRGNGPSAASLKLAATDTENWLYHTGDYSGSRLSLLTQINRDNIEQLQVVCLSQLGGVSEFQTGPVVYQGIMYLTSGADTIAIDAVTCQQQWRYQWQHQDETIASTNRGVAIADGYVVRGTADGYLIALDSLDGSLLWARQVAEPEQGEHFTMAPMIYEDAILIGPAGSHYGISGWIGAFNLKDGEPLWQFDTVPGISALGGEVQSSPLGIKIGGGAIWTPLSLDVENEALFVAVTNPSPAFPSVLRPGDNLYTNSILSLDVKTGVLNWYKQIISADDHGWDLTQVSPLFSLQEGSAEEGTGETRNDYVASAGKDGLLRVINRNTQEELFQAELTTQLNVDAPVTVNGTYTCPGVLGGVLWNGPALAQKEGLLITPAVNLCSTFYRARETRYIKGRNYFDGTVVSDASTLAGWLTAIDYRTGELRWQFESQLPMVAAVTTTDAGLVLTGEMTGDFIVLDSTDGEVLYRFNTGGAIGGGIITYQVEDKQYIAVASGTPSVSQVNGEVGSPTIIIFSLP